MPHRFVRSGFRELLASSLGLLALNVAVIPIFVLPFVGGTGLGASFVILVLAGAMTQIPIVYYQLNFVWITLINLVVGSAVGYVVFIAGEVESPLMSWAIFSELSELFQSNWSEFATLVPPIEPTLGFVVPLSAFIWLILVFSFQATVRFRSAVSAVIPLVMLIGVLVVLSRSTPSYWAALLAIVGFIVYGFAQRSRHYMLLSRLAPEPLRRRVGLGSTTLSVVVVVIVAAIALAAIPEMESQFDVQSLRRQGAPAAPRTVNSPMVGLRNLLGAQSNYEVFTVAASQPAYWRLTALDDYDEDRDLWVSTSRYNRSDRAPGNDIPTSAQQEVIQHYSITGLTGIWLPTAFAPRNVDAPFEIRSNYDTASYIVASDATPSGGTTISPLRNQQYRVESAFYSADAVAANDRDFFADPGSIIQSPRISVETAQLLRLSVGYSNAISTSATELQFLRNLQDWFRQDFTYNENVNFSRAHDPLAAFLTAGEGFCQQFASAFALIAEAHGFDVRVAVGFTPGEVDWDASTSELTQYVVTGKYAHAWPEVHIDGVGWVPFEPTPTRGNPLAEQITGVPAAQHDPSQDGLSTEAEPNDSAGTETPPPPETTTTTALEPEPGEVPINPEQAQPAPTTNQSGLEASPPNAEDDATSTRNVIIGLGLLIVIAGIGAILWRRRDQSSNDNGYELSAAVRQWSDVMVSMARYGVAHTAATTPFQLAQQLQIVALDHPSEHLHHAVELLSEAAELETLRRYGPDPLTTEQSERLSQLAQELISLDPSVVGEDAVDHPDADRLGV